MVLKAEQERVGTILKETITTMCKNSLSFSAEFSVEALIGITLDQDEVFLVSIKELVKAQQKSNEESSLLLSASDGENSSNLFDNSTTRSGRKRKRRKCRSGGKQAKRANPPDQSNSDDNEADPFDSFITEEPGAEEPMSPQPDVLKEEVQVVGQLDVKQEMDSWLDTAESTSGDQNQSFGQELDTKGVECVEEDVSGQQIPTVVPAGAGTSQQEMEIESISWEDIGRDTTVDRGRLKERGIATDRSRERVHSNATRSDNRASPHRDESAEDTNMTDGVCDPEGMRRNHGPCQFCAKTFRSRQGLWEHEKYHRQSKQFVCAVPGCSKVFARKQRLEGHFNCAHRQYKPYRCTMCNAEYSHEEKFKAHVKEHRVPKQMQQCADCSAPFNSLQALHEHRKANHSSMIFRCDCGATFKWRTSLNRHKRLKNHN